MQEQPPQGKRKAIAKGLLDDNPCYVLIEIHKHNTSKLDCFSRKYFLVPICIPAHIFKDEIRKRLPQMDKNNGLYLYIDNKLVANTATMGELYQKFKDEDGFLYMEFTEITSYG